MSFCGYKHFLKYINFSHSLFDALGVNFLEFFNSYKD